MNHNFTLLQKTNLLILILSTQIKTKSIGFFYERKIENKKMELNFVIGTTIVEVPQKT